MNWHLLFLKLSTRKKSNIIMEITYRDPSMNLTDFNINYLNKFSRENMSHE